MEAKTKKSDSIFAIWQRTETYTPKVWSLMQKWERMESGARIPASMWCSWKDSADMGSIKKLTSFSSLLVLQSRTRKSILHTRFPILTRISRLSSIKSSNPIHLWWNLVVSVNHLEESSCLSSQLQTQNKHKASKITPTTLSRKGNSPKRKSSSCRQEYIQASPILLMFWKVLSGNCSLILSLQLFSEACLYFM